MDRWRSPAVDDSQPRLRTLGNPFMIKWNAADKIITHTCIFPPHEPAERLGRLRRSTPRGPAHHPVHMVEHATQDGFPPQGASATLGEQHTGRTQEGPAAPGSRQGACG